jgi:DNA-binding response OmpR family regulator
VATQKILVVDDSIMIRKMVGSILVHHFEVLEAQNGAVGLEVARQNQPDLILLDFVMPQMNGYETLQALRQDARLYTIPVIMMSGMRDEVSSWLQDPFEELDFLEKPFEAETLIKRIQRRLQLTPATTPADAPTLSESQILLKKLTELEALLVQGTDNLIQREVVGRFSRLDESLNQHTHRLSSLEQHLERVVQEVGKQNRLLLAVVNELKQVRQWIVSQSAESR